MTIGDKTFTSTFNIIPEDATGQALGSATAWWNLWTYNIGVGRATLDAKVHIDSVGTTAIGEIIESHNDAVFSIAQLVLRSNSQLGNLITYNGDAYGWNAAATVVLLAKNTATGRSINAAGTFNANGADYAEYEYKRNELDKFLAGDIVGFDANGLITNRWVEAFTFGIISSNPAFVGGDDWATEEKLGASIPDGDKTEFNKLVIAKRNTVELVAYAGKTPVNINGNPGDFIIAQEGLTGNITGKTVDSVALNEQKLVVGQVRKSLPGGRCEAVIK